MSCVHAKSCFYKTQAQAEWFVEIVGWLVASVVGVKKVGEYLPATIQGVKGAIKSPKPETFVEQTPAIAEFDRLVEELDREINGDKEQAAEAERESQ